MNLVKIEIITFQNISVLTFQSFKDAYSYLPNNRAGWNKRAGWTFFEI